MVPVGNIMWTLDYWTSSPGWLICRLPSVSSSPWSAEVWSCTLDGSPCLPFVNTRSGAYPACTQMYSDLHDADGNGNIHNGHPWCETYEECDTKCGPCSCGAGGQVVQSYGHVALQRVFPVPSGKIQGSWRFWRVGRVLSLHIRRATEAATPSLREAASAVVVCTPGKLGDQLGDLV